MEFIEKFYLMVLLVATATVGVLALFGILTLIAGIMFLFGIKI